MTTTIPIEWLRVKRTPEEFERAQLERRASAFNLPLEKIVQKFGARPFGQLTPQWRAFIEGMEPSDELWSFSSSDESFARKLGCAGYAIVRDGKVHLVLVTIRT